MKLALITLAAFLCACAIAPPPHWEATNQVAGSNLEKDSYECERDKRSTNFRNSYESRNFLNEGIWADRADAFYKRCMEVRGWQLVPTAQ